MLQNRIANRSLRFISLILLLCLTALVLNAQILSSARILRTSYDADNNLVVQVDIASDAMIAQAQVRIGNSDQTMIVETSSPVVEQWFLLDAGSQMLNVYALVGDEIRTIIANSESTALIGGIILGQEVLEPTDDAELIEAWLDAYIAQPQASGCIFDELDTLANLRDEARIARRILIVTATNPDTCTLDYQDPYTAIDIIEIGNSDSRVYQDIANQNEGDYFSGTVLSLSEGFNRIRDRWSGTILTLAYPLDAAIETADISITLANGEVIQRSINPIGEFTIIPTATPIPPTATATTSPTPTATPTNTAIPTVTEIIEIVETTVEPEETEIVAVVASETPSVDEILENSGSSSQFFIYVGIGAVIIVLVLMAVLFSRNRTSQPEPVLTSPDIEAEITKDDSERDSTDTLMMSDLTSNLDVTKVGELINEQDGTSYDIHSPISILGRREGSDIYIEGDKQISREHIRFTAREDGTIWAARMTSNPIILNGYPMETNQQLREGDVLQLSPTLTLRFVERQKGEDEEDDS